MALVACPECSGTLSTKATACPRCGYSVIDSIQPADSAVQEAPEPEMQSKSTAEAGEAYPIVPATDPYVLKETKRSSWWTRILAIELWTDKPAVPPKTEASTWTITRIIITASLFFGMKYWNDVEAQKAKAETFRKEQALERSIWDQQNRRRALEQSLREKFAPKPLRSVPAR